MRQAPSLIPLFPPGQFVCPSAADFAEGSGREGAGAAFADVCR
ncbi:MAG: hypothetical protein OXU61_05290 [Gammaproteobacteria bacterium]|nr:hypothetical protein [Gammaproteobacteria bacterium]